MNKVSEHITINPGIMGGVPVFKGTRVPITALSDYLSEGETIDTFVDDFPSVKREQVVALVKELMEVDEHHASAA
jgi:uncharacterized protein (DUF433 family)